MDKQLYHLTSGLLKMNRLLLFLLIAFPLTLKFYSPPSDDYPIINNLLASIGGIFLLGWLYAIGHRANEKLVSQGMNLNAFKYFNWTVILIVASYILGVFTTTEVHSVIGRIHVNYVTPMYLPIIFLLSFLATMFIAAKTLVSAELNREAGIGEFLPTLLLMIIAAIGLWFIQPRVQKI